MSTIAPEALRQLARSALECAGASTAMATSTAAALVAADAQGLASHGVSRVSQYCGHLRHGRVDGRAEPSVIAGRGGAVLIDAADGLAFPACELAICEAIARAREFGVAFAGVTNSHHFGAAALHLDAAAKAGMVGLAFGNSPKAMPAWAAAGPGRTPLFGTNPVAAVFPRRDQPPLVIDLSLSEVARGKLMVAAREGNSIPPHWALDRDGNPTTDPNAGLDGMMLPAGGMKGAMLALMVELLCCALTGARLGFEADSFFSDVGNRPRIGQAFIIVDPGALAGNDLYHERIESLIAAMLAQPEVRIPGQRRIDGAARAEREGIAVPDILLEQLRKLAVAAA